MSNPSAQPLKTPTTPFWIKAIKFNADGLLPAIAQDKSTGEILMMAWMNREALEKTAQTKTAVYFSRSRNKLWLKGETSGHNQHVHDIFLDCDGDALILVVTQVGGIACHTGRKSCFYQRLDLSGKQPNWRIVTPVLKDPDDIYASVNQSSGEAQPKADEHQKNSLDNRSDNNTQLSMQSLQVTHKNDFSAPSTATILNQLDSLLIERKQADADSSYVASLYAKGINKILEKVGEESIETVIAAKDLQTAKLRTNDKPVTQIVDQHNETDHEGVEHLVNDLIYEVADVWFHTLVTLAWFDIKSDDVLLELARRFGMSGIEEKNSRNNKSPS